MVATAHPALRGEPYAASARGTGAQPPWTPDMDDMLILILRHRGFKFDEVRARSSECLSTPSRVSVLCSIGVKALLDRGCCGSEREESFLSPGPSPSGGRLGTFCMRLTDAPAVRRPLLGSAST